MHYILLSLANAYLKCRALLLTIGPLKVDQHLLRILLSKQGSCVKFTDMNWRSKNLLLAEPP